MAGRGAYVCADGDCRETALNKGALARARTVLDPLAGDSADGVANVAVVSANGVVLFREAGTKVVPAGGQVSGDPLLEATSNASQGQVVVGDPSTRSDGTTSVGMGASLAGATPDAPPAGMLRLDISLSGLIGGATGRLAAGSSLSLIDTAGSPIVSTRVPGTGDPGTSTGSGAGGPSGNTFPAIAPIPGHPDWRVRLAAPVSFGSPSIALFALLALAVVVLLSLVVWISRQILRPAQQLESSRVRMHDLFQMARVDSLRDTITGLGNHLHIRLEIDKHRHAMPQHGMVIHQHHF